MPTAVLEVGGTHASAVLVTTETQTVLSGPAGRIALHDGAPAGELLDMLADCVRAVGPVDLLAVAIPGPFDYERGMGLYRDVAKFDALRGVDLRAELRSRGVAERIVFVNDAEAFGLGEWVAGVARGVHRIVAITLGTGVGSVFLADGVAVRRGRSVPPNGYVYLLTVDGRPLEDIMSRRSIVARYGIDGIDVGQIADRAAGGDRRAHAAFTEPLGALGTALAPWLTAFDADVLVVGGAMSRSWSLVEPALWSAIARDGLALRRTVDTLTSTAIGAAWHAVGANRAPSAPTTQHDEQV